MEKVIAELCSRGYRLATVKHHSHSVSKSQSLAEGAITVPGYTADGWSTRHVQRVRASSTRTSRSATTPTTELHDFLHREPVKVRINGINLTYEGLVPRIQKSFLSKDVDALQPHIRAFVERAVTFSSCPDCGGTRLNEAARSSKIGGVEHRRRLRDADQRPGRVGARPGRTVRRAAPGDARGHASTRSSRWASATSASTGRLARSRAARRSAPG